MDATNPYVGYKWDVVKKCYVDQALLISNLTCVVKDNLHNGELKRTVVLGLPSSFYELQVCLECMRIFELIGLDQFFKVKPS